MLIRIQSSSPAIITSTTFSLRNPKHSWTSELVGRTTDKLDIWPEDWTELNVKIKARDHWQCLISGSKDSLSASYIVGKKDETWLNRNRMRDYLKGSQCLLCHNPRNLFTLRLDLLLGQFDEANFVIVPKLGQLVVHFFQPNQSAKQYHNTPFGHNHALSHELLYARFAWSLMKIVKHSLEGVKTWFKFLGTPETDGGGDEDDGGGRGGRRRSGGQGRGRGRYSRGINKGTRSGLRKRKGEGSLLDSEA
ncbi:hypothetical protein AGABI1DRAFT_132250 [Agaricus bisporus var. burnettii JB137-S8]|uniref:HNH nuclease domain-containing protein n=1 Tax=Agaricus bisporus var. burnettii (strain JB137-S8 / ATCC MYA-4627 / FGSC 10392) TaxID=597362 RepID=K5WXB4_AGABU|nr:uncharacterized protein AGABI1DRAFT_132250 [Agaricus bisporus var. burnettii JB137-S8]EKM75463.1 hypothetical protein AGABI1DRAFT_132250 [Agaricus bisporus var. burnettii JB137-S8]